MKKMTRIMAGAAAALLVLAGCSSEASTASRNIDKAAENFEVERRITFINGITDEYLLTVEGKCSTIITENEQLQVTCKVAEGNDDDSYWRHTLGLSDNVTFIVEQTAAAENVDGFRHRIIFRPETIIPAPELSTSGGQG